MAHPRRAFLLGMAVVVLPGLLGLAHGAEEACTAPAAWQQRAAAVNLFYTQLNASQSAGSLPQIGNGFVSTEVLSDDIFLAGVFNGANTQGTHRARIPAFHVALAGDTGSLLSLKQYRSDSRQDDCLCATDDKSVCPSNGGNYQFVRVEGLCAPEAQPGTTALNFFWDGQVSDNAVSTASDMPGYTKVRVACYVWTDAAAHPGLVPLDLYYSSKEHDHLTVATAAGRAYAQANGYALVGTQGYVQAASTQPSCHLQALDVEAAVFYDRSTASGGLDVEHRFYAHYTRPSVLVHDITLTNRNTTAAQTVRLVNRTATASTDLSLGPLALDSSSAPTAFTSGHVLVPEVNNAMSNITVAMVVTLAPAEAVNVAPGKTVVLSFYTVLVSTLNSTNPLADAREAIAAATASSAEALFAEHTQAWLARYQHARIGIQGDLALAASVNASMYQILQSVRPDWPYGISPGGLGNSGYNGHSFWDMDTWMAPTLLLLHPETARGAMLDYRFIRLPGARAKALANGYVGAMYPWESSLNGVEDQYSNGQMGQWGKYEHHITGDVALVYQQYWRLSGDKAWLQAKGNEVAQAAALYWSSRVTANLDGSFSIKGVMGPDEFHYPVDDSAYTNAIARISLDFALEAAAALGTAPAAGNFSHIADNLRIIVDRLRQIHPEFAGYLGSQVKQADTVLLGFPLLARNLTRTLRANDLLYYESRTDPNGPAMTYAMFAVGWLDVGNHTKAQQLFVRGYANVQAPFYIWTETPSGGCPNFVTGAGGFLQSVAYGYGGLRIVENGLQLAPPPLMDNVTSLLLDALHYQGWVVSYEVTATTMSVLPLSSSPTPLEVVDLGSGAATPLAVGTRITLPKTAHLLRPVK